MGRVESERAFVHYSSNPLQPLLGFKSHHNGHNYEFQHVYVEFPCSFLRLWMIYFIVVSAPPYPGYWGCFRMYGGSQNLIVLWALLIIWDASKHKCVTPFPSSN